MDLPATKQIFKHKLTELYSKLLATPCLLCGQRDNQHCICAQCLSDLPVLDSVCPHCAMPNQTGSICGQCLKKPPKRDQSLCLYSYQDVIIRLIADFKYHQKLFLSRFFAHHFAQKVLSLKTDLPQLLIPIPLHARRLRERGYNRANELATDLSKLLDIPINNTALIRRKDTQPQTSLPYSARKKTSLMPLS